MVHFHVRNGLYNWPEHLVINYHLVWEAYSESIKVSTVLAAAPIYTSKSCFSQSDKVVDPLGGLHVLQQLSSACFQELLVITDMQVFWPI